MADSNVQVTEGTGKLIDTRTNVAGDHRQVTVIGDPSTNDGVAVVRFADPASDDAGVVVREVNSSAMVAAIGGIAISDITRVDRVHNLVDGTISTFTARPDINRVHNIVDGTISTVASVTDVAGFSARPDINRVHNLVDGTISTVASVTSLGGTIAVVQVSNAGDSVYYTKTYSTSSGSVVGSYPSGKTVAGPDAGDKIKVFAISVTTTAQEHMVVTFNNGAESTPTEYWRYALQAPAAGIAGANLAVTPPGYLFATGVGSTLGINVDSDSLVHYSVSYFVESE